MTSDHSYRGFRVRDRWLGLDSPGIKALADADGFFQRQLDNAGERAKLPYKGITADGTLEQGLFRLEAQGDDTAPIRARAEEFLACLSEAQRAAAMRDVESPEWWRWHNAFEAPHGASLRTMSDSQRHAALAVIAATMSQRGFETARTAMKLNETLGELVGNLDLLGEWNYSMHIFGTPSAQAPWGWQLHGHHLVLSCLVLEKQIVMTPAFVGAEPAIADGGKHAGLTILREEEAGGLRLMNALSSAQLDKAVLFPSTRWADLPPERTHYMDGRHQGGAFRDNVVLPYEGLPGTELQPAQRELLLGIVETYVSRMSTGHARAKMAEVEAYLPRTYFAWMGGHDADSPFYYKVHSPVILIEFDHHHGVFLNNDEPEKFHIHTIVRTPNGNDYGRDLLRQHYALHHSKA